MNCLLVPWCAVFWQTEVIYHDLQSNTPGQWRRLNFRNTHIWYWAGQPQTLTHLWCISYVNHARAYKHNVYSIRYKPAVAVSRVCKFSFATLYDLWCTSVCYLENIKRIACQPAACMRMVDFEHLHHHYQTFPATSKRLASFGRIELKWAEPCDCLLTNTQITQVQIMMSIEL